MAENLHITAIQTFLFWENAEKNRQHFSSILSKIKNADVIILPEMFTTGFTMNTANVFEEMGGISVEWLKQKAKETNACVTGSLIIKENESYYNRMIWAEPDGKITHYDKRHLFRMAEEHQSFSGGKERVIVNCKGWRILLQVCYDLRFSVFSRNKNDYDIAIYVANWPMARNSAWKTLLQARAIENLSYVIGVNRIGEDGKSIPYSGDSAIIDFKGNYLQQANAEEETVISAQLSHQELVDFREKFPAHLDADNFTIH